MTPEQMDQIIADVTSMIDHIGGQMGHFYKHRVECLLTLVKELREEVKELEQCDAELTNAERKEIEG